MSQQARAQAPTAPASESVTPDPALTTDLAWARAVVGAKQLGASWAQIARVTGEPSGKAAKAKFRKAARRADRALRLREAANGAG